MNRQPGLIRQGVHDLIGFINSLSKKYGMTVIFSTHDVSLVAEVADYIYVMNKGRFVAEGSVEEIFMQTGYAQVQSDLMSRYCQN